MRFSTFASAVGAFVRRAVGLVVSPGMVIAVLLLAATAMAMGGVYLLLGLGWALVIGALPIYGLALILLRGLTNG